MNFIITLIILIFIIAVLSLYLWVTRKSRFGKGSPTSMGQFVGEQLLLVNKDQRRAVEEVIYQREDERREDVGRFEG